MRENGQAAPRFLTLFDTKESVRSAGISPHYEARANARTTNGGSDQSALGLDAEPEFAAKPCPCVNPLPIGAACGDIQNRGRLLARQSGEIAQFHELCLK